MNTPEIITLSFLNQLIELAAAYRLENPQLPESGLVTIYKPNMSACGWSNELRNPEHWEPGVYQIDRNNNVYLAVGGSNQDGAKLWQSVKVESDKKYFSLIGLNSSTLLWEVIFGDYDKECVIDEKEDCQNSSDSFYKRYKIITTNHLQIDIDKKINDLNKSFPGKKNNQDDKKEINLCSGCSNELGNTLFQDKEKCGFCEVYLHDEFLEHEKEQGGDPAKNRNSLSFVGLQSSLSHPFVPLIEFIEIKGIS